MGELGKEEVFLSPPCPQRCPKPPILLSSVPLCTVDQMPEGWLLRAGCVQERVGMYVRDLASCPLLLSHSRFLSVAENSPVPLTYLSKERCPAQLRGQANRSEKPCGCKEPGCARGQGCREEGNGCTGSGVCVVWWAGDVPPRVWCLLCPSLPWGWDVFVHICVGRCSWSCLTMSVCVRTWSPRQRQGLRFLPAGVRASARTQACVLRGVGRC